MCFVFTKPEARSQKPGAWAQGAAANRGLSMRIPSSVGEHGAGAGARATVRPTTPLPLARSSFCCRKGSAFLFLKFPEGRLFVEAVEWHDEELTGPLFQVLREEGGQV
jgi:hypothetical protein